MTEAKHTPTMDQYAAHFADEVARLRDEADNLRARIKEAFRFMQPAHEKDNGCTLWGDWKKGGHVRCPACRVQLILRDHVSGYGEPREFVPTGTDEKSPNDPHLAAAPEPPAHDDAVVERVAKDNTPIMRRLLEAIADSENDHPGDDSYIVDLTRADALAAVKRIVDLRAAIAAMPANPLLEEAVRVMRIIAGQDYEPVRNPAGEESWTLAAAEIARALLSKLEGEK